MDNSKRTKMFSIRVTEETHQKLKEEATLQKRKPANLANLIIESYFEKIEEVKKIANKK